MAEPIIAITTDVMEPEAAAKPRSYFLRQNYAAAKPRSYFLRQNYADAVRRAGGAPLLLPHEPELAEAYLARVDGLVVTGGDFDVDPALFGAAARHPTVNTKDARTAFEMAITRAALARGMPVLGICGGQQLLNVALGGTLIQHIPDEVPAALEHEQPNPRTEPGHEVRILEGTLLHRITGDGPLPVNSAHHQAAKEVGEGVVVNALAPDGVIEGIEDPRLSRGSRTRGYASASASSGTPNT
jgi:putative glutamine amidotransferase